MNKENKKISINWKEIKLGDIITMSPSVQQYSDDMLVSFLGMADISEEGKIININIKRYKEVSKGFSNFKNNDVLVAKISPCFENGKGAIVIGLKNGIGFGSTEFHVLRSHERIIPYYLYTLTKAHKFRYLGASEMTGTAGQRRVPSDFIKNYKILLPPLSEQIAIAKILSEWDKAIDLVSHKIELKEQLKKGLMQRLLTGKVRLKGFNGEWEKTRLGELIKNINNRNNKKMSRVLSVSNKFGFILPENYFSRSIASSDLSNYKIISKGEFAYNPSRLNVGSIARLESFENGILSPMYIVFKCVHINSNYFYQWIKSAEFYKKVKMSVQGSVRESVDFNSLSYIQIKIPSDLAEQTAIAEVLTTADDEISLLKKQLDVLKLQKKGLMQKLLTGKTRVKV